MEQITFQIVMLSGNAKLKNLRLHCSAGTALLFSPPAHFHWYFLVLIEWFVKWPFFMVPHDGKVWILPWQEISSSSVLLEIPNSYRECQDSSPEKRKIIFQRAGLGVVWRDPDLSEVQRSEKGNHSMVVTGCDCSCHGVNIPIGGKGDPRITEALELEKTSRTIDHNIEI